MCGFRKSFFHVRVEKLRRLLILIISRMIRLRILIILLLINSKKGLGLRHRLREDLVMDHQCLLRPKLFGAEGSVA